MTCWSAERRMTDYIDGRLRKGERSRLENHLRECASCSARAEQLGSVRAALGELHDPAVPGHLKTMLRIQASREREAVILSHGSQWNRFWLKWKFRVDEFMRPLTIPATGGLVFSLILFGGLTFTISTSSPIVRYEIPVIYADHAEANLVPLELRSAVILTLSLDGNGRITDYSVRDSSESFVGDPARLQSNNIALPEFPSVLALAQPVNGDVSILFRPIVFRQ